MNRSRLFLTAAFLLLLPTFGRAAILQFQFSGTVDDVPAVLSSEFAVGESITGVFSVNTTLNGFLYDASGLSLTIGGDYGVTALAGTLSVLDDFGGSFDSFHASFDGPLTGAAVNGRAPVEFDLSLALPTSAFSSGAVPLSVPLNGALSVLSSIDFAPDDDDTLTFRVTALAPVPEPSLTALLGAGTFLLTSRLRVCASRP